MLSWANSGSSTFLPLLLLLLSGVSLETAANFLLFLNVAIFLEKGKISSAVKTEFILFLRLRSNLL